MIDPADAPKRSHSESATVQVEHRDAGNGVCGVRVQGEVDLASAPALKAALAGLLAQGFTRFAVDLSGVRHMDSTGLGVLVGFRRRLEDASRIAIAAARPTVRAIIELTGLEFPLFETAEEAEAHLSGLAAKERPPALSADSAMVIGLVSTALPFADSPVQEAERWLRVLRLHGEAGRVLTSLGLSEAPLDDAGTPPAERSERADGPAADPIDAVTDHARRAAADRGAATVGTADLLRGAMAVYGAEFEWVLRAHGCDPAEVLERLAASDAVNA
jgi:anti-sigma B factor antagonist